MREKATARLFLGMLYYNGCGVAQDYPRARGYFEAILITEGAGGIELGVARRFLGEIYYNGYGVKRDKKISKKLF